mmetsp:Transcript_12003/g.31888  ORF Transcript_12003/g.31888 Transcript_12003/m.31888 type:complete len:301 (-) Transcript_12003:384-1286(-)
MGTGMGAHRQHGDVRPIDQPVEGGSIDEYPTKHSGCGRARRKAVRCWRRVPLFLWLAGLRGRQHGGVRPVDQQLDGGAEYERFTSGSGRGRAGRKAVRRGRNRLQPSAHPRQHGGVRPVDQQLDDGAEHERRTIGSGRGRAGWEAVRCGRFGIQRRIHPRQRGSVRPVDQQVGGGAEHEHFTTVSGRGRAGREAVRYGRRVRARHHAFQLPWQFSRQHGGLRPVGQQVGGRAEHARDTMDVWRGRAGREAVRRGRKLRPDRHQPRGGVHTRSPTAASSHHKHHLEDKQRQGFRNSRCRAT